MRKVGVGPGRTDRPNDGSEVSAEMEKPDNTFSTPGLTAQDYSLEVQRREAAMEEGSGDENDAVVNYMNSINSLHHPHHLSSGFSLDRLSFSDVMQFADFGPNHGKAMSDDEAPIDPAGYFLKFPVLNEDHRMSDGNPEDRMGGSGEEETLGGSDNASVQLRFLGENPNPNPEKGAEGKNKRKRPRSAKTTEEVESQRMTHIAVERNRRKQMNEHLRVLRSLMPGSYVQRVIKQAPLFVTGFCIMHFPISRFLQGDQASIIGGAIEFVRELEQLLQCLESQKRRRLFGGGDGCDTQNHVGDSSSSLALIQPPQPAPSPGPPFFPSPAVDGTAELEGLREEAAESKSSVADVEVKVLGLDAMIKILSRRRPGQLIKTIAALEDLQLSILHTNITTIDQTVLYSFNVKVACESRFTADDIAGSVQQIFSFIHANTSI